MVPVKLTIGTTTLNPRLVGLALVAATMSGCGGSGNNLYSSDPSGQGRKPDEVQAAGRAAAKALAEGPARPVAEAQRAFSLGLLRHSIEDEGNVCISPASIWLALSMTYNGAAGDTRTMMAKALSLGDMDLASLNGGNAHLHTLLTSPPTGVRLSIANSLWAKEGIRFEPEFMERNREFYRAQVETLDFTRPDAAKTINDWVAQATEDRIQDLIDSIPNDAMLYLVNALHFDGRWSDPFSKDRTREADFRVEKGSPIRVPMMNRTGSYDYFEEEGVQAVRIPYGNGRWSLVAVLPPQDRPVRDWARSIDRKSWEHWVDHLGSREVALSLPKWRQEYKATLNATLAKLGMAVAFNALQADFSGMRKERDLYISRVVHKTFIEVDEEGTEAAAATGVEMRAGAMPAEPAKFVADRPFLYAITDDESGTILFIGLVASPTD
jgi:serine protease inhibitor